MANTNSFNANITIGAAGEIITPSQTRFKGYLQVSHVAPDTGDGTLATITCDQQPYDIGNCYDGTTFTAPVTALYLFTCNVSLYNIDVANSQGLFQLVTTGRNYNFDFAPYALRGSVAATYVSLSFTTQAYMTATDTAVLKVSVSNGVKQIYISGYDNAQETSFSGVLLG